MRHLGDITKIHGDLIDPVDCITGGSPCQDLSIAGKRAGLAGERSGLFMEMIRIIKEMRDATNGEYPKFAIWENVKGAFSSNKGEDFRCVLEEFAHIVEADVTIPRPSGKNGKWSKSGAISGNGWSLAWRLFDAQYWGVPQRRQRIALVVDFRGQCAAEILFERTSLSGNTDKSIQTWKEAAGLTQNGTAGNDRMVGTGNFCVCSWDATRDGQSKAGTEEIERKTGEKGTFARTFPEETAQTFAVDCRNQRMEAEISGTIQAKENGGYSLNYQNPIMYNPQVMSVLTKQISQTVTYECAGTLGANDYKEPQAICIPVLNDQGGSVMNVSYDVTGTLRAQEHGHQPIVFDARGNGDGKIAPTITGDHENRITDYTAIILHQNASGEVRASEVAHTLSTNSNASGRNTPVLVEKTIRWIVRRLTPVECERLQGYPCGWTDIGEWTDSKGKKHKPADSPRYKALGNSIALPQWFWIVQKMRPYIGKNPTLGSLFDGIGGFPLVWETTYGKGTAKWASEIEEFPIAVTKVRFSE